MTADLEVLSGIAIGGGIMGYVLKEVLSALTKRNNGNGTALLQQRLIAVEDKCTEMNSTVQEISHDLRNYSMTVASAIADHGARLTVLERRMD